VILVETSHPTGDHSRSLSFTTACHSLSPITHFVPSLIIAYHSLHPPPLAMYDLSLATRPRDFTSGNYSTAGRQPISCPDYKASLGNHDLEDMTRKLSPTMSYHLPDISSATNLNSLPRSHHEPSLSTQNCHSFLQNTQYEHRQPNPETRQLTQSPSLPSSYLKPATMHAQPEGPKQI